MSACVSRQYLGCIGKTDNGQIAVAAGLSQSEYYTPIDMRLFMPKEWKIIKSEDGMAFIIIWQFV
ncbi:transposase [Aquimarina sp. RZ0]|nr:transposase [Aquimarina sp. RZ0]